MITEEQIPEILDLINLGGEKPEGVNVLEIKNSKYSKIYFKGLGVYNVENKDNLILLKTEKQVIDEYLNEINNA